VASCASCHNGTTAPGKAATHIRTLNSCEDCHNTIAWSSVPRVDHGSVLGNCSSCHNGATAPGKPQSHVLTSAECDTCHSTSNWSSVNFDHSSASGSCSNCHNGTTAPGKSPGHFITALQCDTCHRVNQWLPSTFVHSSPLYPSGHRERFTCNDCHLGNSEANPWLTPSYQPDCAGCHASDYKRESHKKSESPEIRYTVSELRDCTGSCHMYTDGNFTRIKKARSGEHRLSDDEF